MRKIPFALKYIIACIVGFFLQFILHEMGHAIFALITGNKVVEIHLGIISYAEIMVVNKWSIWLISIGSFVFPLVICSILDALPFEFTKALNIVVLVITTIQLIINATAIICVRDWNVLKTYDLGICVTTANMNSVVVSIVSFVVVAYLVFWIVRNFKKIIPLI